MVRSDSGVAPWVITLAPSLVGVNKVLLEHHHICSLVLRIRLRSCYKGRAE